ncbi:protein CDV3 homolog [Drosophila madeirensis]|uniref:Protein CDV3 homolog n=1 Tax=Drosophila madeirensis TaxID=30013 RepID=A0AAU9FEW4_DROMD
MSNLEDFFSKKDHKKSKKNSEYLATEELYKTLEESTKDSSEDISNLEFDVQSVDGEADSARDSAPLKFGMRFSDETYSEEDEWSDFTEENRAAPFAGSDMKAEPVQLDTGGDGIDVGLKEIALATSCPWQKPEQANHEPAKQNELSDGKGNNPAVAKKQIYIPPALRQSQGVSNKRKAQPQQRKVPSPIPEKPQAPDLNSLEYFPSLSGSKILKRPK